MQFALTVPSVLDRFIQQAVLQVLQRRWDRMFSDHIYGFRAGRSAHQAVAPAQQYVHHVMERLLPREALRALMLAIELEIISQELDAEVVRGLPGVPITVASYAEGYRHAGRRADRERQIELLGLIGGYLDHVVRKPIIRALVRLARGPAHAAGFGTLQEFLERGLDAFVAMQGAGEFLSTIRDREVRAMERVFAGTPDPFEFDARPRTANGKK